MRSLFLLLVALGASGCTVSALSKQGEEGPSNSCSSDSDCSNAHCSEGLCQTLRGEIETLLLSATPSSDSTLPHLGFVTNLDDVPTSGGRRQVTWPGAATLKGSSFQLPKAGTCYPNFISDDPKHPIYKAPDMVSLPVDVTLSLRQRLLGLPQQTYYATTGLDLKGGNYTFDLQVPSGEYDVYLAPPAKQSDCPVPPQLLRGKQIDSGNFTVSFVVTPSSTLSLLLRWPKGGASLDGWIADIIEPVGGNVISTQVVLGSAVEQADTFDYSIELVYSTVVDGDPDQAQAASLDDLFRLRPPGDVVAPTIYLDRPALELFGTGDGKPIEYTHFTRYPAPVQVEAQLVSLAGGQPMSGQVWLSSSTIAGVDDGVFASFVTNAQIDADGNFRVAVPPGHYVVHAEPPLAWNGSGPGPSAVDTEWDVPEEPAFQAGKVLELPLLAEISGQSRIIGAQVRLVASQQIVLPFEEAFGKGFFLPRASSALVDDSGGFVVQADPGVFDLSVQPPEASGFAWFVRPGLSISGDQDLGRVNLPLPAAIEGDAVLGKDSPLAEATIRAYAYLDKQKAYTRDPKEAWSVVEVAETRADNLGHFRLLIPERLSGSN